MNTLKKIFLFFLTKNEKSFKYNLIKLGDRMMKKMFLYLIVVIIILPLSAVYHKIGDYDTPGSAHSVFVSNNIAYVTDDYAGLLIIDVSNPQNPTFLGSYYTTGHALSVFVSNNIAYVIDDYEG